MSHFLIIDIFLEPISSVTNNNNKSQLIAPNRKEEVKLSEIDAGFHRNGNQNLKTQGHVFSKALSVWWFIDWVLDYLSSFGNFCFCYYYLFCLSRVLYSLIIRVSGEFRVSKNVQTFLSEKGERRSTDLCGRSAADGGSDNKIKKTSILGVELRVCRFGEIIAGRKHRVVAAAVHRADWLSNARVNLK